MGTSTDDHDPEAPNPPNQDDQEVNIHAVEYNSCKIWFTHAQEQEAKKSKTGKDNIAVRLALLRALALRHGLMRWRSPNWTMASGPLIRCRHTSLMAQMKLMAKIFEVKEPPKLYVTNETDHPCKATDVVMEYDCSRWLSNRLIAVHNLLKTFQDEDATFDTTSIYPSLLKELKEEWTEKDVRTVEDNEEARIKELQQPPVSLVTVFVNALLLLVYSSATIMMFVNTFQMFSALNVLAAVLYCAWTFAAVIVKHGPQRPKLLFEEEQATTWLWRICRYLGVDYIPQYAKVIWLMLDVYKLRVKAEREGKVVEFQRKMAKLHQRHQRLHVTLFGRNNNEILPRMYVASQLLLRGIVDTEKTRQASSVFASFCPFKDVHDRVVLEFMLNTFNVCYLYNTLFHGVHYTFLANKSGRVVNTVRNALSLAAFFIPMTLALWKMPLVSALSYILIRPVVVMQLDKVVTLHRLCPLECSSGVKRVLFVERVLFYATHPINVKASRIISAALRILEVIALSYIVFVSAGEGEFTSMLPYLYAAFGALAVTEFSFVFVKVPRLESIFAQL